MKRTFLSLINSKYLFVFTSLIWWLAFFPGFYSGDSFGALNQAENGPITNVYTAAWPLTLRVLALGGRVPGLATLATVLALSYAVKYFCEVVLPKTSAAVTTFILLITPLVGAMGITLWHDIPMTAGLLIVVAVSTKSSLFKEPLSGKDLAHLIFGALLASYRPNGFPTLFLYFLLLLIFNRTKQLLKYGVLALAVSLSFSLITTYSVGERSLINSIYAQEWMRSDIACSWSAYSESISATAQDKMEQVAPLKQWNNSSGCYFLNSLKFTQGQVDESVKVVPSIWLSIFRSHPLQIGKIHAQRNAYLIPIPTYRAMHPPFIHSIIEFPDLGIKFALPSLVEKLRPYVRIWNGLRPITAFAGLWLAVIIGIAIFVKRRRQVLLPTLAMSLALEAILFAVAPIPDGRYALLVLIVGQSLFVGYFLDFLLRKRGQFTK